MVENQKQKQMVYFNKKGLWESEINRPHDFGRLYEFFMDYKMQKMAGLVEESMKDKDVLNACCGSGMEAEYFTNLGAQLVGLDISLGAVRGAKMRSKRFDFMLKTLVADAENLPFKPEIFDFVFKCAWTSRPITVSYSIFVTVHRRDHRVRREE